MLRETKNSQLGNLWRCVDKRKQNAQSHKYFGHVDLDCAKMRAVLATNKHFVSYLLSVVHRVCSKCISITDNDCEKNGNDNELQCTHRLPALPWTKWCLLLLMRESAYKKNILQRVRPKVIISHKWMIKINFCTLHIRALHRFYCGATVPSGYTTPTTIGNRRESFRIDLQLIKIKWYSIAIVFIAINGNEIRNF